MIKRLTQIIRDENQSVSKLLITQFPANNAERKRCINTVCIGTRDERLIHGSPSYSEWVLGVRPLSELLYALSLLFWPSLNRERYKGYKENNDQLRFHFANRHTM